MHIRNSNLGLFFFNFLTSLELLAPNAKRVTRKNVRRNQKRFATRRNDVINRSFKRNRAKLYSGQPATYEMCSAALRLSSLKARLGSLVDRLGAFAEHVYARRTRVRATWQRATLAHAPQYVRSRESTFLQSLSFSLAPRPFP